VGLQTTQIGQFVRQSCDRFDLRLFDTNSDQSRLKCLSVQKHSFAVSMVNSTRASAERVDWKFDPIRQSAVLLQKPKDQARGSRQSEKNPNPVLESVGNQDYHH
jgi:hypothetical protein